MLPPNSSRTSICAVLLSSLFASFLIACGGGGGGSSPETPETPETPTPQPPIESNSSGQALLGPIAGAIARVFQVGAYDSPLCTAITSESEVLDEAGVIRIPDSCLEGEGLYLVVIRGGHDIDVNDDGVIDASPTPFQGELHALVSAEQIRGKGWRVNVLTDTAYRGVKHLLGGQYELARIEAALDSSAELMLDADLNDDGNIDNKDVVLWSPRENASSLLMPQQTVEQLRAGLLAGTDDPNLVRFALGGWSVRYQPTGEAPTLSVNQDRAALCDIESIELYDVSNPARATQLIYYRLDGESPRRCVLSRSDVVYFIDFSEGALNIVDFSDLENVRETALAVSDIDPTGMRIVQNRLYVTGREMSADSGFAFNVYDIADPLNPVLIGGYQSDESPTAFSISEQQRIFIASESGLVMELRADSEGDILEFDSFQFARPLRSLAANEEHLYALERMDIGTSRLHVLDISDPGTITTAAEPQVFDYEPGFLQVADGNLYLLVVQSSRLPLPVAFLRFDLEEPTRPKLSDSLFSDTIANTRGIIVQNGVYYVSEAGTLRVSAVSEPDRGEVAFLPFRENAFWSNVQGDLATFRTSFDGLYTVDVSDPSQPQLLSQFDGDGAISSGRGLATEGQIAVTGASIGGESEIWSLDLANPSSIEVVSRLSLSAEPIADGARVRDVFIRNRIAYLALDDAGLMILDVNNPSSPQVLSRLPALPGRSESSYIALFQDILLLIDEGTGIDIIDVSDLTNPRPLSSYDISLNDEVPGRWTPFSVAIQGGVAYILQGRFFSGIENDRHWLEIVNISNPSQPALITTLQLSGRAANIVLNGSFAYIGSQNGVIDVVDISDPVQPKIAYTIPVAAGIGDISVDDTHIYASAEGGLYIFQRAVSNSIP